MPEREAIIEIQSLSLNARHCLCHIIRNHMQTIAGHSELPTYFFMLPPDRKMVNVLKNRLKSIQEAVQTMSEDLRRLGL